MRITLISASMGAGGAERVMAFLANYWSTHGHSVTLISFDKPENDFFKVQASVNRVGLGLAGPSGSVFKAVRNKWRLLACLRKAIINAKPDVVVSFINTTNVHTLLASIGLKTPLIISERADPRRQTLATWWRFGRWLLYRRAAALVVQTSTVAEWAKHFINDKRIWVIGNPIVRPPYQANLSQPIIVAMGRLTYQKGFDLLLKAFANCAARFPDWNLLIMGQGEERDKLGTLAHDLNIAERVKFTGVLEDTKSILVDASLFVMSSRWEGFPNALLEAMACGLPVISFDCLSGPAEIIRHEIDGLLVPPEDVNALTKAIECLMQDEALRTNLARNAREIIERFGSEQIMQQWDELYRQVLA